MIMRRDSKGLERKRRRKRKKGEKGEKGEKEKKEKKEKPFEERFPLGPLPNLFTRLVRLN